jgi:hypothetical protein
MKLDRIDPLSPNLHAGDAVRFHFFLHLGRGDEGQVGARVAEAECGPGHFFDAGDETEVIAAVEGEVGVVG